MQNTTHDISNWLSKISRFKDRIFSCLILNNQLPQIGRSRGAGVSQKSYQDIATERGRERETPETGKEIMVIFTRGDLLNLTLRL